MTIADVVRFLAKDGDNELDGEIEVAFDPDTTGCPEISPSDELEGLMVEFEPVGNTVLTSGTPDEVYDMIEAVRLPLLELRDASTGSTVATVDSFEDIELTMKLDPYAEREFRSETLAGKGAAVVSEPEEVRVELALPVVSVVCDRMLVVVAEVAGAVPATPGKVMPEVMLPIVAGLAVFTAELYEESDASDKLRTSDVPEEDVVTAVPIAAERDTPGGAVGALVDDVVLSVDEADEVGARVESTIDDTPVKPIVSKDAEVEDAEFAVPGPE